MKTSSWKHFEAADSDKIALALKTWQRSAPDLGLLALVSEHTPDLVPMLQTLANQHALPVAGAVVPGLITNGELKTSGALLVAQQAASPQRIIPLQSGTAAATAELAAFVEEHARDDGEDTLLLFIDALTSNIATLLDQLYLGIGNRVRYAGSNVGSETFKPVRCLFDNTCFVENAVLAILLPQHPGAALAHRYCKETQLGIATGASGNRVTHIDGQPAFEAYRELIAHTHGAELTRENFYPYAVHFPLALHLAEGEPLIRIPVSADESGGLSCIGEIPETSLLSVVEAANPESRATAHAIAAELRPHAAASTLAFYCAGRLLHHGKDAAAAELAELQFALDAAPVFGALSLGEIGNYRSQGYPRFHNATIVALPWH